MQVYVVPSVPENGIHLLDFFQMSVPPVMWTTCKESLDSISFFLHEIHSTKFVVLISSGDTGESAEVSNQTRRNRSIPLSEGVTACAAHPVNGSIIAGTEVWD